MKNKLKHIIKNIKTFFYNLVGVNYENRLFINRIKKIDDFGKHFIYNLLESLKDDDTLPKECRQNLNDKLCVLKSHLKW